MSPAARRAVSRRQTNSRGDGGDAHPPATAASADTLSASGCARAARSGSGLTAPCFDDHSSEARRAGHCPACICAGRHLSPAFICASAFPSAPTAGRARRSTSVLMSRTFMPMKELAPSARGGWRAVSKGRGWSSTHRRRGRMEDRGRDRMHCGYGRMECRSSPERLDLLQLSMCLRCHHCEMCASPCPGNRPAAPASFAMCGNAYVGHDHRDRGR